MTDAKKADKPFFLWWNFTRMHKLVGQQDEFDMLPGKRRLHGLLAALLATAALAVPAGVAAQSASDDWKFSITPYLWLPSLDANLRYGPPASGGAAPNVSVDADTLLGALNFALMISGDARKGRWSIGTDLIYLDLSGDKSSVRSVDFNLGSGPVNVGLDTGTDVRTKGTIWSLFGGLALGATFRF